MWKVEANKTQLINNELKQFFQLVLFSAWRSSFRQKAFGVDINAIEMAKMFSSSNIRTTQAN